MICPECQKDFTPKRPHQRFCSNTCRVNNFAGSDGGLRGAVSRVSVLKEGAVSVVVRFTPLDRERAMKLTPGELIEVSGNPLRRRGDALEEPIKLKPRLIGVAK
jgi:hypothetical protein